MMGRFFHSAVDLLYLLLQGTHDALEDVKAGQPTDATPIYDILSAI